MNYPHMKRLFFLTLSITALSFIRPIPTLTIPGDPYT